MSVWRKKKIQKREWCKPIVNKKNAVRFALENE